MRWQTVCFAIHRLVHGNRFVEEKKEKVKRESVKNKKESIKVVTKEYKGKPTKWTKVMESDNSSPGSSLATIALYM